MSQPLPHPVPQRARVVVIGAGQAGLSVAHHLQRLGLVPGSDLVVLDRSSSSGGAWQHRWAALRLGATHRVHDLPGMHEMGLRFDDADRARPARDVVGEYYRRFEQHYDLRVRRPVAVTSVVRTTEGEPASAAGAGIATGAGGTGSDGNASGAAGTGSADSGDLLGPGAATPPLLRVETVAADGSRGAIVADAVVNASGTWGTPFVPWYPGRDTFRGRQLDTTEYRAAAEFAGQDVLVVGGGTSAIGFLLELSGVAARTRWFTRRPVEWSEAGSLDTESAVAAVAAQDRAARAGETLPSIVSGTRVPISRRIRVGIDRGVLRDERMFVRIEPDGVVLTSGEHVHADAIIWATGFRADLRHLAPLRLRTARGGVVVEDGRAEDEPRLFLAGYGPQASTIGANRAGRRIARQVMELIGTPTPAR